MNTYRVRLVKERILTIPATSAEAAEAEALHRYKNYKLDDMELIK